jgi:uridine kinase
MRYTFNMNEITLQFHTGEKIIHKAGCTGTELLSFFEKDEASIVAVKVNNELLSLSRPVDIDAEIEAVRVNSKDGAAVYRRSLCFVLAAAAHTLFPESRLLVGHSLGYGYYYTLESGTPLTTAQIHALKNEMDRLVSLNISITSSYVSYARALKLFETLGLRDARRQLNFMCIPRVLINTLDGFSDMFFGPLVPSTGMLQIFDLMPYGEGFLLRFPTSGEPDTLPEFHDNPKLFSIYKRYKEWGKLVNVTSASSINELINNRKITDFIDIAETFQMKCFSDIADQINNRGQIKIVLIAGPSSSGKTTSAKKLSLQLQALGYHPKIISLDCYYVGRELNPRDKDGKYDYECLEALDIDLLNHNLVDLFDGKKVSIPSYNFELGERYYSGEKMQLGSNDILVMEGIHGLNDRLTPLIRSEYKFKIYLSALTQLNLDDHNRIPTSDNRLIRRIVRDARYRGKSAAETISMWDNVQNGERLHIFPFQDNADAILNTALDYELPVLKVYAEPLLRAVTPFEKEFTEAARLLRFLNNFSSVPSTAVPNQSIIREFIGGSSFHY